MSSTSRPVPGAVQEAAPPAGQSGDHVLAAAMRMAIRHGDIGIVLWADGFEVTGPYDSQLVFAEGSFAQPTDLARFLAIDVSAVSDARPQKGRRQ
ncbi:hypothetical protein ABT173_01655 [Streptomyces sp. NPDC001795]|uniref:hypothetical protein n=1 Tax=Streptomyces sp. NPDC001795 TaxID=3154525 RepID=UPI00331C9FFE